MPGACREIKKHRYFKCTAMFKEISWKRIMLGQETALCRLCVQTICLLSPYEIETLNRNKNTNKSVYNTEEQRWIMRIRDFSFSSFLVNRKAGNGSKRSEELKRKLSELQRADLIKHKQDEPIKGVVVFFSSYHVICSTLLAIYRVLVVQTYCSTEYYLSHHRTRLV